MSLKSILCCSILCSLLLWSCKTDSSSNTSSSESKTSVDSSTLKMAQLINEATARVNPEKISYYLNKERSKFFSEKSKTDKESEKMQSIVQSTIELLNAGETQTAILQFQNLFKQLSENEAKIPTPFRLDISKVIGIAYLRLSENKNRQANNTSASSIIPIEQSEVYSFTKITKTAIQIYEQVLKETPNDLQTQYLLNLAYMTIGEYPSKVPSKWLIPEKAFASDTSFPGFREVAKKTNTALKGLSGGCVVEDFNNDGLLDIMTSSWGFSDPLQLLLNNGKGAFDNKSDKTGLEKLFGGSNLVQADYNNDGFIDVLVLRGGWLGTEGKIPNSLLKNNGEGTFTDVSQETGIYSSKPTQTAAWADFNLDGHLDLIIGNEQTNEETPFPCELYISNGDGTFTDRAQKAGVKAISGLIKGVAVGDLNNDGFPDIYFSRLNMPNKLLMNAGSNTVDQIRFVDISTYATVEDPKISFPTWFFDYNNDGWEDIFVSGYALESQRLSPTAQVAASYLGKTNTAAPSLYKNNGDNTFTEVGKEMGLSNTLVSTGGNYGDLNNDGFPDFYLGTGGQSLNSLFPNRMYINNSGQSFLDVSSNAKVGHIQKGNAIGFGDFDNDGDQDIYAVMGGYYEGDACSNALFENPGSSGNNWITLRLEGVTSNKSAIGARIKITGIQANGKEVDYYTTVSSGGSFGSSSLQQEIGLGKTTKIKEIEIKWPHISQAIDIYNDIEVNQIIKIVEGNSTVTTANNKTFMLR